MPIFFVRKKIDSVVTYKVEAIDSQKALNAVRNGEGTPIESGLAHNEGYSVSDKLPLATPPAPQTAIKQQRPGQPQLRPSLK